MPILLIVLSFLTQNQLFAQHISTRSNQVEGNIYHLGGAIGIGTATVANSALLELQSTEKGILIPRLSTAEMLAITSPANSLLIYNTTEKAFMFYDQTNLQWRIMVASTPTTGSELLWGRAGSKNGTTFLANPNDRVGIGTETPTASLEIVPTTDNALRILTSTTGTPANIQFADQTNANFVGFTAPDNLTQNIMFELPATRGDSGQILTTDGTGKLVWDDKGGAYELWYRDGENTYLGNNNDNVGFGTQKPYKTLHVFRNYSETQEKSTLRLDNLYENGQGKGYKIWDFENNANFLQVYYSEGDKYGYLETTQPFTFENNGKIGLNTTTPQANIHIVDIEKDKRSNILLESKFSNKSNHPPYDLSFLEIYSERGIVGLDYSIDNNKPITLLEYEDGSPLKLLKKVTINEDGYVHAEKFITGNNKFTADNQGNVTAKTYSSNNFSVNTGGEVTAQRFAGDGYYLTNLNTNNIAGTIPESKIENGEYMINSDGAAGQVWTADGQGRGVWQQIPDNNIWHINSNNNAVYEGDIVIGDGQAKDGSSEFIRIRTTNTGSDDWFLGVKESSSEFYIGKSDTPDGKFHIKSNGNVGIGTTEPNYKLEVKGDVNLTDNGVSTHLYHRIVDKAFISVFNTRRTEPGIYNGSTLHINRDYSYEQDFHSDFEKIVMYGSIWINDILYVQTNSPWGDYVFDNDYKLMPLNKLEKYIKANKHLPEIPTAKTIEEKGIDMAKITTLQMKKIEELTLYIIEQNKNIEKMQVEINNLKNK